MTADATTMKCPHCQADVYYTPDMAGQVAECPDCQGDIQLPTAHSAEPRRKIILRSRGNHESHPTQPTAKTEMRELIEAVRDIRRIILIVVITPGLVAIFAAVWSATVYVIALFQ